MATVAILFTNNLRLHDNTLLQAASKNGNIVFPLYFHDTAWANGSELGERNIWPFRAKFLCESVNNLRKNLKNIGSDLTILRSEQQQVMVEFAKEHNISKIYVQDQVWYYEKKNLISLTALLETSGITLYTIWDHTLAHKDDLDFHISDMPQVFTQFRKSVEKNSEILPPIPAPKTLNSQYMCFSPDLDLKQDFWYAPREIDPRRAIEFVWWEDAALERLHHYFWETNSLSEYKNTRNGLIWENYSSKFSPYLTFWCISPRYIYNEIQKYEKNIVKNSSTYWLVFELLWRDFFQFIFLENPLKFFNNYDAAKLELKKETQIRKFEKWKQGTLWVDFVDANMRELAATGFMSNRGRQVVASYLVNDLKVDWRLWAKYFENRLTDYDVASNWWNWAYVAGVWNDPRDNRYFNIEKQAHNYDTHWKYRKLWSY